MSGADLDGAVQDGTQLDGLLVQFELAPHDARHIQEVINEPRLQLDVAADHLQVQAQALVLPMDALEHRDRGQHGREGRT